MATGETRETGTDLALLTPLMNELVDYGQAAPVTATIRGAQCRVATSVPRYGASSSSPDSYMLIFEDDPTTRQNESDVYEAYPMSGDGGALYGLLAPGSSLDVGEADSFASAQSEALRQVREEAAKVVDSHNTDKNQSLLDHLERALTDAASHVEAAKSAKVGALAKLAQLVTSQAARLEIGIPSEKGAQASEAAPGTDGLQDGALPLEPLGE